MRRGRAGGRGDHADRDHQDQPGLGRPPARELGVTDVGENRDQEAAPKAAQCADLPITWHFVGQLQTNKAASVARYADVVHSVDRLRLVRALGTRRAVSERVLTCLVQVNLMTRQAIRAAAGPGAGQVGRSPRPSRPSEACVLGGVMAVAPLGMPPRRRLRPARRGSPPVRAVRPAATHHFGGHER